MAAESWVKLADVLKWPVTVFGIAVVLLVVLKRKIGDLIARTRSIGRDGLKASGAPDQPSQEVDKLKEAQNLMQVFDSPVLLEQESIIKRELRERDLEHEGETVDILVRHLARCQIVNRFEEIYRSIFGSQIFLLRLANTSRATGLAAEVVNSHYADLKDKFSPDITSTFIPGNGLTTPCIEGLPFHSAKGYLY